MGYVYDIDSGEFKNPTAEDESPTTNYDIDNTIIIDEAKDRFLDTIQREQGPSAVKQILSGALGGNLHYQGMLFESMIDSWPRLQSNLEEVQGAVRDAEIEINPFSLDGEEPTKSAVEKAKMVDNALNGMRPSVTKSERCFKDIVFDLAGSYYLGHGVMEVNWERSKDGSIIPKSGKSVPWRNFAYPTTESGVDRLMLSRDGMNSTHLEDFPEHHFLIGIRKAHGAHASVSAGMRCLTTYWLAIVYGLKWLMSFAQLFGQPLRWGEYVAGDEKAKKTIVGMLKNMGSNPWAAVPVGNKLNVESSGTSSASNMPQVELQKIADKTCDIYILGQSLTSDVGDSGSRSLGEVHNEVRLSKLQSVADYVQSIIQYQLICSILTLNYGDDSEMPTISITIPRPSDEKGKAERDKTLFSEMGLPVTEEFLYERHNVPQPKDGEKLFSLKSEKEAKNVDTSKDSLYNEREKKDIKASSRESSNLLLGAFNPNQKRGAKGTPNGGRWIKEPGAEFYEEKYEREQQLHETKSRLEQWLARADNDLGGGISIISEESAKSSTYTESGEDAPEYERDASGRGIFSEEARLIERAKDEGFYLSDSQVDALVNSSEIGGGSEHDTFIHHHDGLGVVIRRTINDSYGFSHKSPAQYIKRLEDYNETFPTTQIKIIGVSSNKRGNGVIWTIQPFIEGGEFESESSVQSSLEKEGFKLIGPARYRHTKTGRVIYDAHSGNLLKTENGDVFAVDVIVSKEKKPKASHHKIEANQKKIEDQVDELSSNVLEDLTSVSAEWLSPVKPFFDRLAALASSNAVTDEDFVQALESAKNQLPELFDKLDTDSLATAFENAIGTAMLSGVDSRISQGGGE